MIIISLILVIFLLSYVAVILGSNNIKNYFLYVMLACPFVLAGYLYDNFIPYLGFGFLYLITIMVLINKSKVVFYIVDIKNNLPIGLAISLIFSGVVYYIVSNQNHITEINDVEPKLIITGNDTVIDLVYLLIIILFIYIIGSWGVSRRRPKYLMLLSKNAQSLDKDEKEND